MKSIRSILIILIVALSYPTIAQKTGNIVEIFGKEKTTSIDEGTVIHQFNKGLTLKNGNQPGLLHGNRDIVYWQIATDNFTTPTNNEIITDKFANQDESLELKWEEIESDSSGVFKGNLRHSLLYTSFNSPENTIALLDASGHTRVYINGQPHEGDHYEFGYTLIPFKLKRGLNEFVYTDGRFAKYKSQIIIPSQSVLFSVRDMTLPSILRDSNSELLAAIRIINASEKTLKGYSITCQLPYGETTVSEIGPIIPLTTRKVKYKIPPFKEIPNDNTLEVKLVLKDNKNRIIDTTNVSIPITESTKHHERTFVSNIDGSVQYFSVAPSLQKSDNQALVLSVHGASVEARNQARAYKQKDWTHIVAPTNRRPFGFNWEEWGRIDAIEVLEEAKRIYQPNPEHIYLTGHSMGGHGTWYLGATYPDKWGAIAPAAGYPDITKYRRSEPDTTLIHNPHFNIIQRAASGGRTLDLLDNYLQSGVYILHGSADKVVPTQQARMMRNKLGTYHNNFVYYEYPGGSHWYGDHSVDWAPLFDFFKQNKIIPTAEVDSINFTTAAPVISATNYWLRVNQQERQYQISNIRAFIEEDKIVVYPNNICSFSLLFGDFNMHNPSTIVVDNQTIKPTSTDNIHLIRKDNKWVEIADINPSEKHAERQGGFKMAFNNNVVFVYATHGNKETNEWYLNKARFDAETFLYRGNGSIDIVSDREFKATDYKDRNVVIYGNADNNSAWKQLLKESTIRVTDNKITFGDTTFTGKDLGTYFIYPRADSETALIGVVAGSGNEGMKALYTNDYFSGITGFPDFMIFNVDWIKDNPEGIITSGFFGNDWGIKTGNFAK